MVKIKDIVAYLQKFDQDAEVNLDKNGWMEDELPHTDVQQLIAKRGVFSYYREGNFLIINN